MPLFRKFLKVQKYFLGYLLLTLMMLIGVANCSAAESGKSDSRYRPLFSKRSSRAIQSETLSSTETQKRLEYLKNFEAQGKLGYSDGKRGGNANLRWEQRGSDYLINLYGPLGSGSLQIKGTNGSVFLVEPNGKTVTAKSPEDLVKQQLGWTIPVSGLRYWLRGMSAPNKKGQTREASAKMTYNAKNELQELVQQGWTVQYLSYQNVNGLRLPYKLVLSNQKCRLKFVFQKWTF